MKKNSVRILHCLGDLRRGGASVFAINNMLEMKKDVIFDFLIRSDDCAYEKEIKSHNGRVYVVPSFPKHIIRNYLETKKFFQNHCDMYDAIHVHANALIYLLPLKLAKKNGINIRIIHSHNCESVSKLGNIIHRFHVKKIGKYANRFCACGVDAGKWMFGNANFMIINNAVNTSLFQYNEERRNKLRKQLGVDSNTIILGNIARFETQKNHKFLIEIFEAYHKINKESVLLLVGDGTLTEEIKRKAKDLLLIDSIIFAGEVSNSYDFYQAMDCYIFPSLYEGLPFCLIEAQISGLYCLVSDTVTNAVNLTPSIHNISLEQPVEMWIKKICKTTDRKRISNENIRIIEQAGYSTSVTAKKLVDIYRNM